MELLDILRWGETVLSNGSIWYTYVFMWLSIITSLVNDFCSASQFCCYNNKNFPSLGVCTAFHNFNDKITPISVYKWQPLLTCRYVLSGFKNIKKLFWNCGFVHFFERLVLRRRFEMTDRWTNECCYGCPISEFLLRYVRNLSDTFE